MRAIVIEKFGGPDSLVYTELPEPEPKAGHVVIEIKAFMFRNLEITPGHRAVAKLHDLVGALGRSCLDAMSVAP
ncbi:hypothetical protein [Streptomyces sp. NPDC039016]|uniref:hypothetical protein n=1 Tax=Streptomyces sp. NPDC039016 TaxID=3154330 RepID=UPI0033E752E6